MFRYSTGTVQVHEKPTSMMIYSCSVMPTHTGPVLVTPQVGVLTPRHWNLDNQVNINQVNSQTWSQNLVPSLWKALVCAMARAIFTPSTKTWKVVTFTMCHE